MKIGIYEKAINNKFSWEEKIIIAKKAGYDFIEFSVDESDEKLARLDWDDNKINELKQLLIKHNFIFNSITLSGHRKYPFGSKDAVIRKQAYAIMAKTINLALKLGIKNIQLAGYDVYYEKSDHTTHQHFLEGIKYAVNLAMQHSIMLSFETMDTLFMNTISKAMLCINKINSPWLALYPDCGNLFQWTGPNFEQEVMIGKDKIIAVHFKDTKPGIFRDVPFGAGSVDFIRIFKAFAAINFQGPWLIEMWSKHHPDETISENITSIKTALEFFNTKRKGIL